MVKNIIRFAIVLLILHACYRLGIAYLHYEEFRDDIQEMAVYSKDKDDAAVVDRVMQLADRYDIPLDRDSVYVRRDPEHTYIEASYDQLIDWLPGYQRPWRFTVKTDAWHVRPPTANDIGK